MPTFYETHISPIGMARDSVFWLLSEAARYRNEARAGRLPRAYAISCAREMLAHAYLRDRSSRRDGFRLA